MIRVGYEALDSRTVFQGDLSRIRMDTLRLPDGSTVEREIVEHPSAVAIVPVDEDRRVTLLRHYRHAAGETVLEVPAGKLDDDREQPHETAQRELAEEVGLAAETLAPLVTFHNSAGWTDEQTTVYLATGLRSVAAPEDFVPEGEEAHMDVLRMPLAEAVDLARTGAISDAKTLIGLLLAADRLDAGRAG